MTQIPISSLDLWRINQNRFLEVFDLALSKLRKESSLPDKETELTRKLFGCLLIVIKEIDPHNRRFPTLPVLKASCQPDFDDQFGVEREAKRPDIQWGFRDDLTTDALQSQKMFVVECKRLGVPSSPTWKLNENYVLKGVRRFKEEEHGYAKAHPSGAMVGYVQNMDIVEVLREVNDHVKQEGITQILLSSEGWQIDGVSHLSHSFARSFSISPFELFHRWVDLRRCYPQKR